MLENGETADEMDVRLSRWNRGNAEPARPLADELVDLILQYSYEQRQDGQHRLAFAMLLNFGRRFGWSKRIVRELVKVAPHWIASRTLGRRACA
jgi:hypothetical protein